MIIMRNDDFSFFQSIVIMMVFNPKDEIHSWYIVRLITILSTWKNICLALQDKIAIKIFMYMCKI